MSEEGYPPPPGAGGAPPPPPAAGGSPYAPPAPSPYGGGGGYPMMDGGASPGAYGNGRGGYGEGAPSPYGGGYGGGRGYGRGRGRGRGSYGGGYNDGGTEICKFFSKMGACRHGDGCSKIHQKPTFGSRTLLLPMMYANPEAICHLKDETGRPRMINYDPKYLKKHFERFYVDIFQTVVDFGDLREVIVCDNLCDHLLGNVYLSYDDEAGAKKAMEGLSTKLYNGILLLPEFSPVQHFEAAKCQDFAAGGCTRGAACNFLHIKEVSESTREKLERLNTRVKDKRRLKAEKEQGARKRSRSPVRESDRHRSPPRESGRREERRDDRHRDDRDYRRDDRRERDYRDDYRRDERRGDDRYRDERGRDERGYRRDDPRRDDRRDDRYRDDRYREERRDDRYRDDRRDRRDDRRR